MTNSSVSNKHRLSLSSSYPCCSNHFYINMRLFLVNFCLVSLLTVNGSSAFQFQALQSPSTGVRRNTSIAPTTTTATNTINLRKEVTRRHEIFPSVLAASTTSNDSSSSSAVEKKLDVEAIFKYAFALSVQMGLFFGFFSALDNFIMPKLLGAGKSLPMICNIPLFYVIALKSRIFNPLSNRRPKPSTKEITNAPARKMPTWTPPGFIFPIVWLLLIGPLRAVSSSMIVKASGGVYANKAILSLILHLSIGDIWNTINNVERRYGTSVLGVFCVYTSAAFAAWQYYLVSPLAGKLLSLKLIWLTIASSLIFRTWRLNPNPETGKPYSLLPTTGEGSKTEVIWFQKK